jgi:hypothetical protein
MPIVWVEDRGQVRQIVACDDLPHDDRRRRARDSCKHVGARDKRPHHQGFRATWLMLLAVMRAGFRVGTAMGSSSLIGSSARLSQGRCNQPYPGAGCTGGVCRRPLNACRCRANVRSSGWNPSWPPLALIGSLWALYFRCQRAGLGAGEAHCRRSIVGNEGGRLIRRPQSRASAELAVLATAGPRHRPQLVAALRSLHHLPQRCSRAEGLQGQLSRKFPRSGRGGNAVDQPCRCSLSEFVSTDTELMPMAAAAIIGLRRPAAATGMATTL